MSTEEKPASRWLVSTQWLQDHLDAPDIVVVDGSFYLPAHEARRARGISRRPYSRRGVLRHRRDRRPFHRPAAHAAGAGGVFVGDAGKLGIGDGSTIVVYDGARPVLGAAGVVDVPAFGARDVFILDGGLPKWKAEGRPLESGEVRRTPRQFNATLQSRRGRRRSTTCKRRSRQRRAGRRCARAGRFRGEAPEPRPGLRSGHMPGALNVPFDRPGRGRPADRAGDDRRRSSRQAASISTSR